MPSHMLEVLGSNEVVELIGQCDTILYKAISGVLIPGTLQPLPARYCFFVCGNLQLIHFFDRRMVSRYSSGQLLFN